MKYLHELYTKRRPELFDKYVHTLRVGDIDENSLFKSTHWFKNSEGVRTLRSGIKQPVDTTIGRGTSAESLKYGRGAKMNDIVGRPVVMVGSKPIYSHPSKKDIRDNPDGYKHESTDYIYFDPFTESDSEHGTTKLSPAEAKRTLNTLCRSIINYNDNKTPNQSTAKIISDTITNNLLSTWAHGYNKVTVKLTGRNDNPTLEFKVPSITPDFVERFIAGRESINGFLHRDPEIKINISTNILTDMKSGDDLYNFFQAAIKYYDTGINTYSTKLMSEVMKLPTEMKRLITTTKLSSLVTCPIRMLFTFDHVDPTSKDTFKISQSDIKTVNQFVKNIQSRYKAPEKEKKQIIADMNEMLQSLRSAKLTEAVNELVNLITSVTDLYEGRYDDKLNSLREEFMTEQVDTMWNRINPDPKIKYYQEKTGVKKLKKIPADLVAYITIEAESIRDATDKMMIASYCVGKIEIVEWYIELIDVGSKKYIVPHTKPYLESVRTQLLACYKKIMATPIPKADRPLIDIQYPKGYEG